jgi:ABC-2 type transport system ATP-binding protein
VRADAPDLWRRVGHLVETATAYPELSVWENLDIARRLQHRVGRSAVDAAIERLGLGPYATRRAGTLSLGNLQRLALARALLHDPELLVLDEPANGLDPAGVIEIRELLRELATERGATIFMSSHILAEVDLLATRVGIVHRGRLIEELDSAALARHRDPRLQIATRDLATAATALRSAGFLTTDAIVDGSSGFLELRDRRALERPDEVAQALVEAGQPPTHLAVTRETLEDHFVRVTSTADAA